jgi:hypothetical protein
LRAVKTPGLKRIKLVFGRLKLILAIYPYYNRLATST